MKKKMTIFILAIIVVGIVVITRLVFVWNGQKLSRIVFKSQNLIVQQIQTGCKELVILGSGYSLSVNRSNRIVKHDPFMVLPDVDFPGATVMTIFYPFECNGLESAGKDLSDFINSVSGRYDKITLVGHSKCGVCFANAAKWMINCDNLNIITISSPFKGTVMADNEKMKKSLNGLDRIVYCMISSNHAVDKDLCPGSSFLKRADYTGLMVIDNVNIISVCPKKSKTLFDVLLKYVDDKCHINGDGMVSKDSQILSESEKNIIIEANHAESLQKAIELLSK